VVSFFCFLWFVVIMYFIADEGNRSYLCFVYLLFHDEIVDNIYNFKKCFKFFFGNTVFYHVVEPEYHSFGKLSFFTSEFSKTYQNASAIIRIGFSFNEPLGLHIF